MTPALPKTARRTCEYNCRRLPLHSLHACTLLELYALLVPLCNMLFIKTCLVRRNYPTPNPPTPSSTFGTLRLPCARNATQRCWKRAVPRVGSTTQEDPLHRLSFYRRWHLTCTAQMRPTLACAAGVAAAAATSCSAFTLSHISSGSAASRARGGRGGDMSVTAVSGPLRGKPCQGCAKAPPRTVPVCFEPGVGCARAQMFLGKRIG